MQLGARLLLLVILFVLATFAGISNPRDLTEIEAQILWTIRDGEMVQPGAPLDTVRALLRNTRLAYARADYQPPLYTLALDTWTVGAGSSYFAARLFSAFWMLLGLAAVFGAAYRSAYRNAFDAGRNQRQTASDTAFLVAALAGINIVYFHLMREAGIAAMVFGTSALAQLAFVVWQQRPTRLNTVGYVCAITLALAVSPVALILVVVHAMIQRRAVALALIPAVALTAWIAVVQPRVIPDALIVVRLMLAVGMPLLAWIGAAWALSRRIQVVLMVLSAMQVVAIPLLVLPAPPWSAVIAQVRAARQPLEPALTSFTAADVAGYYAPQLREGISIDLSWRSFSHSETMQQVEAVTRGRAPVWIMMPVHDLATWTAAAALDRDRSPVDRYSVDDVVFYRFDVAGSGDLAFRFGSYVMVETEFGRLFKNQQRICVQLQFQWSSTATPPNTDPYSYLVAVQNSGETLIAETFDFVLDRLQTPCIEAASLPIGRYALLLQVLQDERPLPVIENGTIPWGDSLILGELNAQ